MSKNLYTSQFATKVEVNSKITQTAQDITLSTDKKLENYSTTTEMNSAITVKANEISSEVGKKVGNDEIISKINQSAEAVGINANKIELSANDVLNLLSGNSINLTSQNITISSNSLNVDKEGNMIFKSSGIKVFKVENKNNSNNYIYITDNFIGINKENNIGLVEIGTVTNIYGNDEGSIELTGNGSTIVRASGITTPTLTQTSLESEKKNFEKLKNALDIIKTIDIYRYNLKTENDKDKKHIGFVIGDNYNYSKEVTSLDNTGVDTYSFVSLCCKAIQEQQEQIEELKKEIEKLKGEKNGEN